jgi:hypothetical protein
MPHDPNPADANPTEFLFSFLNLLGKDVNK